MDLCRLACVIFETSMGRRPNKASWYALTWLTLDSSDKYDFGAEILFKRSAYRDPFETQNARLTPPSGVSTSSTAPKPGPRQVVIAPYGGAVVPHVQSGSTPFPGHHLEIPSPADAVRHRVKILKKSEAGENNGRVRILRKDVSPPLIH